MSTLEKAIALATTAHAGQKDKAGAPYILHPLRVMLGMDTESEMTVAVLQDVLEDSPVTEDDLRKEGFSEDIVEAVRRLTRNPDESYEAFIERVKSNDTARKVKMADIEDNMNVKRFKYPDHPTEKDIERLKKYYHAWLILREKKKRYMLFVDENFLYHNKAERYLKGVYEDCETAVSECKKIVDDFLMKIYGTGKTEQELWEYYTRWGEEPWVMEEDADSDCGFSAWEYANRRVKELGKKVRIENSKS